MSLVRRGGPASTDLKLEGAGMTDYETLSLVIMIIGLVVSTVMLGITIGSKKKDDRH